MSAHTPGPWFLERHGTVTADVGGHRRQVASTTGDAVMHGDVEVSVVELQMANARLIAAAPELLARLKLAAARCDACATCGPSLCAECAADAAAIAKAEGRHG